MKITKNLKLVNRVMWVFELILSIRTSYSKFAQNIKMNLNVLLFVVAGFLFAPSVFAIGDGSELERVEQGELFGYKSKTGDTETWVIQPQFSRAENFENGLAVVEVKDSGFGLIDPSGEFVVQPELTLLWHEGQGLYRVYLNGCYSLFSMSGGEPVIINDCQYDDILSFSPTTSLAAVQKDSLWGFIDRTGELVIPATFENFDLVNDKGFIIVKRGGKYGLINAKGEILIELKYDSLEASNQGLYWAKNGEKFVLITEADKVQTDTQFDEWKRGDLASGYFVKVGGKWGVLNEDGTVRISPQFDDVQWTSPVEDVSIAPFEKSNIVVSAAGKFGVADQDGKWLLNPEYEAIGYASENLASVRINGKWGVIDRSGALIIPADSEKPGKYWSEFKAPEILGIKATFTNPDGQKICVLATHQLLSGPDCEIMISTAYEFDTRLEQLNRAGLSGFAPLLKWDDSTLGSSFLIAGLVFGVIALTWTIVSRQLWVVRVTGAPLTSRIAQWIVMVVVIVTFVALASIWDRMSYREYGIDWTFCLIVGGICAVLLSVPGWLWLLLRRWRTKKLNTVI